MERHKNHRSNIYISYPGVLSTYARDRRNNGIMSSEPGNVPKHIVVGEIFNWIN